MLVRKWGNSAAVRIPASVIAAAALDLDQVVEIREKGGRYDGARGMMICCPMTTKVKGYVFEVAVSGKPPSAVLADQIRSLDWRARRAARKGIAEPRVLAEVRAKIKSLLMR